jgi:hypothetical protein
VQRGAWKRESVKRRNGRVGETAEDVLATNRTNGHKSISLRETLRSQRFQTGLTGFTGFFLAVRRCKTRRTQVSVLNTFSLLAFRPALRNHAVMQRKSSKAVREELASYVTTRAAW